MINVCPATLTCECLHVFNEPFYLADLEGSLSYKGVLFRFCLNWFCDCKLLISLKSEAPGQTGVVAG